MKMKKMTMKMTTKRRQLPRLWHRQKRHHRHHLHHLLTTMKMSHRPHRPLRQHPEHLSFSTSNDCRHQQLIKNLKLTGYTWCTV
jgi:hypothetical protein